MCVHVLGGFAVQPTLAGSVIVDLVGSRNLPYFFKPLWKVAGTFGAAARIVAFNSSMNRYYAGKTFPAAFSLFFHLAAGLALLSTALYGLIHKHSMCQTTPKGTSSTLVSLNTNTPFKWGRKTIRSS